jgi:hypothetical protein
MSPRNRYSLLTKLFAFSALALFTLQGQARAETSPPAGGEKAGEATTPAPETTGTPAAPAPETTGTPAAPAGETIAPAAPATPTCECPPPCPAPPPTPPAPAVEWKAQIKGGLLFTSGNAQSKNFNLGVNASGKMDNNKLALEGGLAYGTTNALVVGSDSAGNPTYDRTQVTSTNNWAAKGRYDRFLTENNTAFAGALIAADKIAGKSLFGGAQAGYSRQVLKDEWNLVVAEIGYDFSHERYVQPAAPAAALDAVSIHSARVFVGETLSLTKETGVAVNVEALFNLNKETNAIDVKTGEAGVDAFKDIRLNAKLALSTNLWESLSFGFSFTLKYDQNPAPRPAPKIAPAGFSFPKDDPLYFSDKVDTFTEATLIYSFF